MEKDKLTYIDLITTYWAQIVLLLGFIGFIIKTFFSYKLKKLELNHVFYINKRFKVIDDFLKAYANAEFFFINKAPSHLNNPRLYLSSMEELILPIHSEINRSFTYLKIYLSTKELILFESLIESVIKMDEKILSYYLDGQVSAPHYAKNEFKDLCDIEFQKNNNTIDKISRIFSRKYQG